MRSLVVLVHGTDRRHMGKMPIEFLRELHSQRHHEPNLQKPVTVQCLKQTCVSKSASAGSRLWKLSSPQKAYSLFAAPAMAMEGNGHKRTSRGQLADLFCFRRQSPIFFAQQDLINILDCDFWGFPIFWMAVLITVFLFLLQYCICNMTGADK